MKPRRALVLLLVVASVAMTACTPQELGEFFATTDLRTSDNPPEVAAGHAGEALDADRAAQQLVDEGLRDKSREKLTEAYRLRPQDARYRAYVAAQLVADGNRKGYTDYLLRSMRIYNQDHSRNAGASSVGLAREWILVMLGALDRALSIERQRTPLEPDRIERLETEFCSGVSAYDRYGGSAEKDVFDLLFLADTDCAGTG
jgi:hypothetical protein